MSTARRNLVWPVLIIGIGIILVLISANVIPEAIRDLLLRSWPLLLVMFGLNILLAGRVRYANWIVFGFCIALVVVVANLAYAERAGQYRTDYRESRLEVLPDQVDQLILKINLKQTRATISPGFGERQVDTRFVGSNESDVQISLDIEGNVATLTVTEDRPGILPRLPEVGRGDLTIFLPTTVPLKEITYTADDGAMSVYLAPIQEIRRNPDGTEAPLLRNVIVAENFKLDLYVKRGNVDTYLPATGTILSDRIQIDNGSLRLHIPAGRKVRFNLGDNNRAPTYVPAALSQDFLALRGNVYQNAPEDPFDIILNVRVQGQLSLIETAVPIPLVP